jgi:hypothetical protein
MDLRRPGQGRVFRTALIGALLAAALPVGVAHAATGCAASIGDVAVAEPGGKSGTIRVQLPVTLNPAASGPVSIAWQTVPGSAGTADFVAASGTLTLPAGSVGGPIEVQVKADRRTESTESFSVALTSASGASIADGSGTVSILVPGNGLNVGDVALVEPDSGALAIGIPVTLTTSANKAVTFGWQLQSATGTVGEDAPAASGTATIAKGSSGTLVEVLINGDTAVEPDETLQLVVTSVSNAPLADGVGQITLRNTDVPPPDPFGWNPPADVLAGDTSILYVESPAGDYIGQGQTIRYTQATSLISVSSTDHQLTVNVSGNEPWTLNIGEPSDQSSLTTGYWENVGRYPFAYPSLSFYGDGRGCNTLLGRFSVDSVLYSGGTLDQVTLRFEQRCETTGPALEGYLRWARNDPTEPPPPGDPADFAWSPPDGAVTASGSYLYYESPPGDYIGQGDTFLATGPDWAFTPAWNGNHVAIHATHTGFPGDWWTLDLSGRYNQSSLTRGLYDDVRRYPFNNPATGGLDLSGDGRGCNELAGSFAVDEISWDPAGLASISARFVQRCELTGPPLYGAIRWSRP